MRALIVCMLAWIGASTPILADSPTEIAIALPTAMSDFQGAPRDATSLLIRTAADAEAMQQDEKCCKVCTKGKACGNSCISRSYECHQPPGCACDG